MDSVVFAAGSAVVLGAMLYLSAFGVFEQPKDIRTGKKPMNDWKMDVQRGRG